MKTLFLVMHCSFALGMVGYACTSDGGSDSDTDTDTGTDTDTDTDTDADTDADTDTDTDTDTDVDEILCPDGPDGGTIECIMCVPDLPTAVGDFEAMGSNGQLGCCSAADGNCYYYDGSVIASDPCGTTGCCLGTWQGNPAHVCCG